MKNLNDFQHLFGTDLEELSTMSQDDISYVEQTHYGDFIVEISEDGDECFRLLRNHEENISMGSPVIEIEYFGKLNNYTWETVFTLEV